LLSRNLQIERYSLVFGFYIGRRQVRRKRPGILLLWQPLFPWAGSARIHLVEVTPHCTAGGQLLDDGAFGNYPVYVARLHFRSAGYHRGITSGIHTAKLPFLGVQVAPKLKHLDRTEPN
jgi:hypothetical protein